MNEEKIKELLMMLNLVLEIKLSMIKKEEVILTKLIKLGYKLPN